MEQSAVLSQLRSRLLHWRDELLQVVASPKLYEEEMVFINNVISLSTINANDAANSVIKEVWQLCWYITVAIKKNFQDDRAVSSRCRKILMAMLEQILLTRVFTLKVDKWGAQVEDHPFLIFMEGWEQAVERVAALNFPVLHSLGMGKLSNLPNNDNWNIRFACSKVVFLESFLTKLSTTLDEALIYEKRLCDIFTAGRKPVVKQAILEAKFAMRNMWYCAVTAGQFL